MDRDDFDKAATELRLPLFAPFRGFDAMFPYGPDLA